MTTTAWTSRVGTVWTRPHHPDVEIRGEHPHAGLVKLDDQWIPIHELEANYTQACCSECGEPLTAMRKLLVDEANRNAPDRLCECENPDRDLFIWRGDPEWWSCAQCDHRVRRLTPDEQAARNSPAPYVKAVPGTYCTGPCCWPPRAPATC